MKHYNSYIKWLYPGLKVKRWLFLALIGIFIGSWGLALIFEARWWTFLFFVASFLEEQYLSYTSVIIVGVFFVASGLLLMAFSLKKGINSIVNVIVPNNETKLVEVIYQKRQLKRGPRIVTLGGGTGLAVLLRGLKNYTSNITAIVTVTDDGGCSGRLRGELGIQPPGDLRNNIIALADKESLLEEMLNYRFTQGEGLAGRNLGNLLIAAMSEITGDINRSIQELSKVLAVRGLVLPVTLNNVTLKAEMTDGAIVHGETDIVKSNKKIKRISVVPEGCEPVKEAIQAINEADAIILGPGSLYTSVLPNLLIKGIAQAINKAKAPVYYVCNVMTQPGETDFYTVSEHLKAIKDHVPMLCIDKIFVNTGRIPKNLIKTYQEKGAHPVILDDKGFKELGKKLIRADLINTTNLVRHDSEKLSKIIMREILKDIPATERIKILDLILGERYKDLVG